MELNIVGENDSKEASPIQRFRESRQPKRKKITKSNFIKSGLGERLRAWRKAEGLNLEQLSKKVKVGITTLSEIETNKSLPSAETLAKLYKKTNLNILWLMFREENMLQAHNEDQVVESIKPTKPKKVVKKTIFNMSVAELSRR